MLLDLQSLSWGEVAVVEPTRVNEFAFWLEGAPLVLPGASREFSSWTSEGALLLDVDGSLEVVITTVRRRVAMF